MMAGKAWRKTCLRLSWRSYSLSLKLAMVMTKVRLMIMTAKKRRNNE